MNTNRKTGGYTLIEVLVAMSILAMTLTVIFRSFSTGLANVSVSRDYAEAVVLAESKLAEISVETGLQPGQYDGVVNDRFFWVALVERHSSPPVSAGEAERPVAAYRVNVDVEWMDHGRSRHVSLDTVRLASLNGNGD